MRRIRRVAMLCGSSWSTEKVFRDERGAGLNVFVGIKQRGEAAVQERNPCARKGHKIAAADARSATKVDDGKRTFGGVMIAGKQRRLRW